VKLFRCQSCDQVLYFENRVCQSCGHTLGYLPGSGTLSALEPEEAAWRALARPGKPYRFCANAEYDVCNWLVPGDSAEAYCTACRHNHLIPDLSHPDNRFRWQRIEIAKHRLFYSLLRLHLPLASRAEDPTHGLMFDFVAEAPASHVAKVMTGHDNGLITLALDEADDAIREKTRLNMGEPYRTLLGHFRHEIGHYYWDCLMQDEASLAECRRFFGDERQDYAAALQRHYETGPPPGWEQNFVSAYASSHPWEDFAETWAHYLHIVDTIETARSFGLEVHPQIDRRGELHVELDFDPYRDGEIKRLIEAWLPLSFAMNSLNRSMGLPDAYPFVLSGAVIDKLGFVHRLIHAQRKAESVPASPLASRAASG
jgi:hypothetical protein